MRSDMTAEGLVNYHMTKLVQDLREIFDVGAEYKSVIEYKYITTLVDTVYPLVRYFIYERDNERECQLDRDLDANLERMRGDNE